MEEGAWTAFLVAQRFAQLSLAQWNTVRLRAAGGVEFGASHYPLIAGLHAFWLAGLWVFGHARSVEPIWLAIFIRLQAGRLWVIGSIGRRWTTRVLVLPDASPVARGLIAGCGIRIMRWWFLRSRWFRWSLGYHCSH